MTGAIERIGHDLQRASEVLAARAGSLAHSTHLLATTTSTNDEAKRAAKAGARHGETWIAEEQTSGRGRQGRSWLSARGESLLFSVLLRVECAPARLPPIALAAGLSVRDAVAHAAPRAEVAIKWPNDVLASGRKVAGVLVEAVVAGPRVETVIVGIGVNVRTLAFAGELSDRATSIAILAGHPPDRAEILIDVLTRLDADLHAVVAAGLGPFAGRLESADALYGRRVRSDTAEEGVASGIDEVGRLLVRRDDGALARWSSGEVHLLR